MTVPLSQRLTFDEIADFVALSLVEHAAHLKVEILWIVELVLRVEFRGLALGSVHRPGDGGSDALQNAWKGKDFFSWAA